MTNQDLIAQLLDWQEHDEGKINDTRQAGADLIKELEANLAQAVEALEQIAKPKIGPDFDWTEEEVNKWRAAWYQKYQDIARITLAKLKAYDHD